MERDQHCPHSSLTSFILSPPLVFIVLNSEPLFNDLVDDDDVMMKRTDEQAVCVSTGTKAAVTIVELK